MKGSQAAAISFGFGAPGEILEMRLIEGFARNKPVAQCHFQNSKAVSSVMKIAMRET